MANIKVRRASLGATLSEATSKQMYSGPCILEAMSVDYAVAANAATSITLYDGVSASGRSVYTSPSINTDFGLTVPTFLTGAADIVAGTSTAGVGLGLLFADGIFAAVTLDVAGPHDITLWLRPLIRREGDTILAGAAGSAVGTIQLWQGPGLWYGYTIMGSPNHAATTDIVFRDSITDAAPTVMTKTDYNTLPNTLRQVATTTGTSSVGVAVTAAATGVYSNRGIYLRTGLLASVAQGNAGLLRIQGLFEA